MIHGSWGWTHLLFNLGYTYKAYTFHPCSKPYFVLAAILGAILENWSFIGIRNPQVKESEMKLSHRLCQFVSMQLHSTTTTHAVSFCLQVPESWRILLSAKAVETELDPKNSPRSSPPLNLLPPAMDLSELEDLATWFYDWKKTAGFPTVGPHCFTKA